MRHYVPGFFIPFDSIPGIDEPLKLFEINRAPYGTRQVKSFEIIIAAEVIEIAVLWEHD